MNKQIEKEFKQYLQNKFENIEQNKSGNVISYSFDDWIKSLHIKDVMEATDIYCNQKLKEQREDIISELEKKKEPHPSFSRVDGKNDIIQDIINLIKKKYE